MNKKPIKLALFSAVALSLAGVPLAYALSAPPDLDGYVCSEGWFSPRNNPGFGKFGGVTGAINTEPFCQGTQVGLFSLYSTGQTLDPSAYSFTETQLWNLFNALRDQMLQGKRVAISGFPTSSSFPGYSNVDVLGH
jgi:hypothetical protein